MKFRHKNMEDFFKDAFSKYEEKGLEHSWFDIDARVTRNNFYKFSFANFNIVYLILIVSTFTLTLYLAYDNFISKKDIVHEKTVPVNIQYVYDTIYETNVINEKLNSKTEKKDVSKVPFAYTEDNIEQNNVEGDSLTEINISSWEVNQTKVDTIRNIIIIKPPPVIVRDTITVETPKNRKNGKKH